MSSKAKKTTSAASKKAPAAAKKTKTKAGGEPELKASESALTLNTAASSAPPNASVATGPPKPGGEEAYKGPVSFADYSMLPFEAGQIFSKYDYDGDGKLNKQEFTELVRQNIDLLRATSHGNTSYGSSSSGGLSSGGLPMEVVSNRILTHFDETAGVAIARSEVDQHMRMGNIVTPLVDAYKTRYERLRALLTGKLFPKREHLLQLRRQLQHISGEVDAKRRSIERETLTDTEQILERLRTVESMRQSAIRHQIIQIEDELHSIERLVRRVERANIDDSAITAPSTGVLLTSAQPGAPPVETIRAPRATSMVEVIQEYADLSSIIDNLSSKPVTVQVDFPTDDFPKETSERLEVIARCDKYMHAINVKDHMLYKALQERDKFEKSLDDERKLSQEYAQEVANWAELAQDLTQQLSISKQENDRLQQELQHMASILRSYNIYYSTNEG
jgi:hypothetical protein